MLKPKRAIPSAINTPTAVHVLKQEQITQDEAEVLVSNFIGASEDSTGHNLIILSQLRRLQRDLRGLPPLLEMERPRVGSVDGSANVDSLNESPIKDETVEEESVILDKTTEEILDKSDKVSDKDKDKKRKDKDKEERKAKKHKKEEKKHKHKTKSV